MPAINLESRLQPSEARVCRDVEVQVVLSPPSACSACHPGDVLFIARQRN